MTFLNIWPRATPVPSMPVYQPRKVAANWNTFSHRRLRIMRTGRSQSLTVTAKRSQRQSKPPPPSNAHTSFNVRPRAMPIPTMTVNQPHKRWRRAGIQKIHPDTPADHHRTPNSLCHRPVVLTSFSTSTVSTTFCPLTDPIISRGPAIW